jgi:hypothetical protein
MKRTTADIPATGKNHKHRFVALTLPNGHSSETTIICLDCNYVKGRNPKRSLDSYNK